MWTICAGHVDAYESLEDAAIREVQEEIGLLLDNKDLHKYKEAKVVLKESNSHTTHYYYAKTDLKENEFVVQKEELSEVKWVKIDDVIEMIKNHDNIVFKEDKIELFKGLKNL